jgi:hypothetical protein
VLRGVMCCSEKPMWTRNSEDKRKLNRAWSFNEAKPAKLAGPRKSSAALAGPGYRYNSECTILLAGPGRYILQAMLGLAKKMRYCIDLGVVAVWSYL